MCKTPNFLYDQHFIKAKFFLLRRLNLQKICACDIYNSRLLSMNMPSQLIKIRLRRFVRVLWQTAQCFCLHLSFYLFQSLFTFRENKENWNSEEFLWATFSCRCLSILVINNRVVEIFLPFFSLSYCVFYLFILIYYIFLIFFTLLILLWQTF